MVNIFHVPGTGVGNLLEAALTTARDNTRKRLRTQISEKRSRHYERIMSGWTTLRPSRFLKHSFAPMPYELPHVRRGAEAPVPHGLRHMGYATGLDHSATDKGLHCGRRAGSAEMEGLSGGPGNLPESASRPKSTKPVGLMSGF